MNSKATRVRNTANATTANRMAVHHPYLQQKNETKPFGLANLLECPLKIIFTHLFDTPMHKHHNKKKPVKFNQLDLASQIPVPKTNIYDMKKKNTSVPMMDI